MGGECHSPFSSGLPALTDHGRHKRPGWGIRAAGRLQFAGVPVQPPRDPRGASFQGPPTKPLTTKPARDRNGRRLRRLTTRTKEGRDAVLAHETHPQARSIAPAQTEQETSSSPLATPSGTTALCAHRTAGVDVERTFRIAAVDVANGRRAPVGRTAGMGGIAGVQGPLRWRGVRPKQAFYKRVVAGRPRRPPPPRPRNGCKGHTHMPQIAGTGASGEQRSKRSSPRSAPSGSGKGEPPGSVS